MFYLEVSYSYRDLSNGGCVIDGVKNFTRDEKGFEDFIIWYFDMHDYTDFVLSEYAFRNVESILNLFTGSHIRVD